MQLFSGYQELPPPNKAPLQGKEQRNKRDNKSGNKSEDVCFDIFSSIHGLLIFSGQYTSHPLKSIVELGHNSSPGNKSISGYEERGGGYMNAPFTIHNTMCAARQGCEIKTPHCVLYHWHCEWLLSNSEEGKKSPCNKTLYNCYCSRDGSCVAKD